MLAASRLPETRELGATSLVAILSIPGSLLSPSHLGSQGRVYVDRARSAGPPRKALEQTGLPSQNSHPSAPEPATPGRQRL